MFATQTYESDFFFFKYYVKFIRTPKGNSFVFLISFLFGKWLTKKESIKGVLEWLF